MCKKSFAALIGIVIVGLAAVTTAQGFFPLHGMTSLDGSSFGFPPNFLGGKTGSPYTGVPSLYFGWLEDPNGAVWALKRQASEGTAQWPLKGIWLGMTGDFTLSNGSGLLLSGGVFLPRRGEGAWISRPAGTEFGFEIPSYDWWYADATAKAYVWGQFEFLAGFRWDHTSVRVDYSDNTSDDYILDAYIPLIGTQVNQRFANGSLLLRVVGSAWVHGNLRYHFWTRTGYAEFGDFHIGSDSSFLEILADYRWKLGSAVGLGAFAKWNWLRANSEDKSLSGSTTESVGWSVDIRSWTLGGVASVDFRSPL
jgi:hypothetical protein